MMTPSNPPATSGTEAAFRAAGSLPLPDFAFGGLAASPLTAEPLPGVPSRMTAPVPPVPAQDSAWSKVSTPYFLPDGSALKLTLSRKFVLLTIFPDLDSEPISPYECAVTLFLCAHPRPVWEAPVPDPGEPHILKPLWTVTETLKAVVDEWLDSSFPSSAEPDDLCQLAQKLWLGEHAAQVVSVADEKKNPPAVPSPDLTPSFTSPLSSPEETRSDISTSSTSFPSGTPTPFSTPS